MKSPQRFLAVLFVDGLVYVFCHCGLWQVSQKAGLPFTVSEPENGTFEVLEVSRAMPSIP